MFDAHVAWLATQTSKTATGELMRVAWRTVGAIITRVWADTEKQFDPFADLARIGIDEISYKRGGHKYLTVVVDHDSGRLVWAAPGQDKATLARFFEALGPERSAQITHVSADGAAWIVQTDPTLGRAYYLKERLRVIFKLPHEQAAEALDKWVGWARRCWIPAFVKLQKTIVKHRTAILASR